MASTYGGPFNDVDSCSHLYERVHSGCRHGAFPWSNTIPSSMLPTPSRRFYAWSHAAAVAPASRPALSSRSSCPLPSAGLHNGLLFIPKTPPLRPVQIPNPQITTNAISVFLQKLSRAHISTNTPDTLNTSPNSPPRQGALKQPPIPSSRSVSLQYARQVFPIHHST